MRKMTALLLAAILCCGLFAACGTGNETPDVSQTEPAVEETDPIDATGDSTEPSVEETSEEVTEPATEELTEEPTEVPTEKPTEAPTEAPTEKPTEAPTEEPTAEETYVADSGNDLGMG